ncbi:MAG: DUF2017 family protein [Acidimicrobiia bacterium]
MSRRFVRRGAAVVASFSAPEIELLGTWVPEQLRAVYESDDSADAARQRLFPRAYLDPTEESAEQEWQALVYPDLLRSRLESLARILGVLDAPERGKRGLLTVELGPDDVPALLGVLNDTRLALGTILDVTDDTELAELDPDDPSTQVSMIYVWLTHIEGELVDTLLGELPD